MMFFCSTLIAKAVIPTNITGTVSITSNDICYGDCVVEDEFITNKTDLALNKNVEIYPNPTKELLNIQWQGKKGSFQIIDVFGKEMMNAQLNKINHQVNTSTLSIGVYIIRLQIDGKNSVQKFVKQ